LLFQETQQYNNVQLLENTTKEGKRMRKNHVKEKLKRGEASLGAWLTLSGLAPARAMARQGFDWLLVDMEHSSQTPALMADMVAAIADTGQSAPFVRVPTNSVEWLKWALDAGAWGVIVPMVNTRQEAENAVSWSKYAPEGTRSNGGIFAPYSFGITDRKALHNLDEILSVPGIDVAFIGPNDLRVSLGLTPDTDGPEPVFVEALEHYKAAAQKHHIATSILCANGIGARQRLDQGFQMISVITDINGMIASATDNLRVARGE
jgi:4-hydroxy-2-oxoheptanedioate aldolase